MRMLFQGVCRQLRRVGRAIRPALSLSFHICKSGVVVHFIRSKLHNHINDLGHGHPTVCWGGLRKNSNKQVMSLETVIRSY